MIICIIWVRTSGGLCCKIVQVDFHESFLKIQVQVEFELVETVLMGDILWLGSKHHWSICSRLYFFCHFFSITARPRDTRILVPEKNRAAQNRTLWGLYLCTKEIFFSKNRGPSRLLFKIRVSQVFNPIQPENLFPPWIWKSCICLLLLRPHPQWGLADLK